jgi:predicted secreted protein
MAIRGSLASFSLGTNVVAELNSVTNAFTGEALDVTVFNASSVKSFISGLKSGTINIAGFYNPTDTNGQVAMFTAFLAGTLLTTTQKPKVLVNGTNGFTADGIITAYNVDATVAGTVAFSATIQLSGTIAVV